MKMLKKLNELEVFGKDATKESVLSFVYQHRIYVVDLLSEHVSDEIVKATEKFLGLEEHSFADCEIENWKKFLEVEI